MALLQKKVSPSSVNYLMCEKNDLLGRLEAMVTRALACLVTLANYAISL